MDPAAKALFRELADRSSAERQAYYVRHRVPAAVRDEVESLLRFDDDSVGSLQGRVAAAANAAVDPDVLDFATSNLEDTDTCISASEIAEGRFAPGTLVADRYRIISLVGRGGMGEVYRATDLKLKQPVALKFLPEAATHDRRLLARFHGEVRLARQISHPNVCRVYDIGEVSGAVFISMEYIDGEDLASLLRRIGRLPQDKAIEIARRLCAGLAAAHDKGVVHRDLKPANVMIDSRGQVLITDFGLAATALELEHSQLRSGTPAYMAPEQLEGREVTTRSDLFALGLVLYEMFTGKAPFTNRRTSTDRPPRIEGVVEGLDRAVAHTIERCMEFAPQDRPSSALAVAASLPGGNPLAEALAAGVTPSPQMVAAAHASGALSVRATVFTLVFALVGLAAMVALGRHVSILHVTPFPYSPEVLEQKAREVIELFGYTAPPRDRVRSFFWNGIYKEYAEQHVPAAEYRAQLAMGQPSLVSFRYRQSNNPLLFVDSTKDYIDEGDPPLRSPGDIYLSLDLHGRLRHVEVVPTVGSYAESAQPVDWNRVFALAGVDATRFTPVHPTWIPPTTFDTRVAWTGTLAHAPSVAMHIEAAGWRGRPVYFRLTDESFLARLQTWYGPFSLASGVYMFAPWIVGAGAVLVAWRNQKVGRAHLRGSARLGAVMFACSLLGWLLTAHHVPAAEYLPTLFRALSMALAVGALGGVLYMAAEPFIRRRWPQCLISWTRVLSGRVRDPLVGGHILVGVAFGVGLTLWSLLKMAAVLSQGLVTVQGWPMLDGPGWALSYLLWNLMWWSVVKALSICVLLLFAKVLLRRDWMAVLTVIVLANLLTIVESPQFAIQLAFELPAAAIAVWLLIRWGVLPMVVAFFIMEFTVYTPLTTDFAAWYSGPTLLVLATVLALAVSSFSVALAGRPLFDHELIERHA